METTVVMTTITGNRMMLKLTEYLMRIFAAVMFVIFLCAFTALLRKMFLHCRYWYNIYFKTDD